MSTKKLLLILLIYIPLIIPTDVSAWDHQRKGFILGMGIGPSTIRVSSVTGYGTEYYNSTGFGIDLKLGYATSNNFQIYYCQRLFAYGTYLDTINVSPLRVEEQGVDRFEIGIGVSFYLDEQAPSFIIDLGFGHHEFEDPFAKDMRNGAAINLATGYEFARHWSLKFVIIWGTAPSSEDYNKTKVLSLMFTVNVLGY